MAKIIGLVKGIYRISKISVEIAGIAAVTILATYSIAYLKGIALDKIMLDARTMVGSSDLAYSWIGVFVVYAIGNIVEWGQLMYKAIKNARDRSIIRQIKSGNVLKWFLTH